MIVYMLRNELNGKCYIGQHRGNDLTQRWNKNFTNCSINCHLSRAVKKYGPAAFSREVLNVCSTQAETDNLERLWIATLGTYDQKCGYNKTPGGLSWNGAHTSDTRARISATVRELWQKKSPAQKRKFSEKMRRIACLQWQMRSHKEVAAIAEKIGKALLGRKTGHPAWNTNRFMDVKLRRRLSEMRTAYWEIKRELSLRKPVSTVQYQRREETLADRKQSRALGSFKGGRYACTI